MSRAGAILLCLTTLVFIASSLGFALRPVTAPSPLPYNEMANLLAPHHLHRHERLNTNLPNMFLRPQNAGMLGLLIAVWAVLIHHALRNLLAPRRTAPERQGPPAPGGLGRMPLLQDKEELPAQAPLIVGLALGAAWPWFEGDYPLLAFLLSAGMLACFLTAAQRNMRAGPPGRRWSPLGFAAGWALMVCLSAFALMLQDLLQLPQSAAAMVAVLIGALAAVSAQLRLGRHIGFSLAVIWGLIGLATVTVTSDADIATATVIAISVIAVALVRVTT